MTEPTVEEIGARLERQLGLPGDCVTVRDAELCRLLADWRERGEALAFIADEDNAEIPTKQTAVGHLQSVAIAALKGKWSVSNRERFLSYIEILPCGCWFWTGGRSRGKGNKKWYGSFWAEGKSWRAHIWAARFLGGLRALFEGEHYDHTCNFSLCVNPNHLEIVTNQENTRRKVERRNELHRGGFTAQAETEKETTRA